nr:GGDEF domain-containing protein [Lachnospiraceae bacterium]
RDLDYDQMDPEVQEAYFIYLHEYWTLTFEAARPVFGLPYTYYLWVKEDKQPPAYSVVYMIDGERTHKPDAEEYVYLGDEYDHDANNPDNAMEWQAWSSGEKPEGYQVWDNEYGHTYAYYTPLIIDGQKMGLIATEVEVAEVESSILNNTIAQVSGLGAVLVMAMIALLLAVYGNYISKLVRLESDIREYSETKDSIIADRIYEYTSGKSEIASLSRIVADTIKELGTYMKNLVQTRQELTATREKADAMSQLATKDALTGIRNKTAYDLEVQNLERAGLEGVAYGLAVVDLNNLKHINDTYGHECGNVAIKKLCRLVCEVFDHSPVFRVGGDEFAVILKNRDLKDIDELIEEFYGITAKWEEDENLKPWEKTSAAIGYAVYDPEKDESIREVFNKADANMYDKKRRMKEEMSGDAQ